MRCSGILLHPTSLPGPDGCGDLGGGAHRFASWLAAAAPRLWQMLPVGPVGFGNSPYSALSAFAGNPLLIGLDVLEEEGWLPGGGGGAALPSDRVDYGACAAHRHRRLEAAFTHWETLPDPAADRADFQAFVEAQDDWLADFVLYRAIKAREGGRAWVEWPAELRDRHPEALRAAAAALERELRFGAFEQWVFDRQWKRLRAHCDALGVSLIGDLPIFIAHDSAEVWAHREWFLLDEAGWPTVVAGVPPDYFSATGQRWGNPLYDWEALRRSDWRFWVERVRQMLHRFDLLRLDHFIGFVRCWEIPAEDPTAAGGRWTPSPGAALFRAIRERLGLERLPFIAEDLGAVTAEVEALRLRLGLPGIRLLQFAFGDDPQADSFKPYNYVRHTVAYTGTHDNDTAVGWFRDEGGPSSVRSPAQVAAERDFALRFLGSDGAAPHWDMIRALLASVADVTIFPLQDVMGLGTEARMNRPGTTDGNWEWRFAWDRLSPEFGGRLREMVGLYGRDGGSGE